ncbi:MAG: hypothetical protein JWR77_1619, partial [Rhizorhabdus sp.]|nr:hypothetical protein [Rhizorhabdus sp.]
MLGLFFIAMLGSDAPAAPPAAAQPSGQAIFDAASKARDDGKYGESVRLFETLEARPAIARNPTVMGTILIRKGLALCELDRLAAAEAALTKGLKLAPGDSPNLQTDMMLGHLDLARIAMLQLDYPQAANEARLAEAFAHDNIGRIRTQMTLARATMFDEDGKAIQYADTALALAAATPDATKAFLADIRTLHARIWLIHGHKRVAYADYKKALSEQGGLRLRVSLFDVATRSDLAIAALLNGDQDSAREYMAYTGAGRLEKAPFSTAVSMSPPPCGGPADLRPDDNAVVEFSIRDDGSVAYAAPVYVSRPGPAALEFARAVTNWSWRSEDVAKIPAFYRLATRVELRCSTT